MLASCVQGVARKCIVDAITERIKRRGERSTAELDRITKELAASKSYPERLQGKYMQAMQRIHIDGTAAEDIWLAIAQDPLLENALCESITKHAFSSEKLADILSEGLKNTKIRDVAGWRPEIRLFAEILLEETINAISEDPRLSFRTIIANGNIVRDGVERLLQQIQEILKSIKLPAIDRKEILRQWTDTQAVDYQSFRCDPYYHEELVRSPLYSCWRSFLTQKPWHEQVGEHISVIRKACALVSENEDLPNFDLLDLASDYDAIYHKLEQIQWDQVRYAFRVHAKDEELESWENRALLQDASDAVNELNKILSQQAYQRCFLVMSGLGGGKSHFCIDLVKPIMSDWAGMNPEVCTLFVDQVAAAKKGLLNYLLEQVKAITRAPLPAWKILIIFCRLTATHVWSLFSMICKNRSPAGKDFWSI